MQGLTKNASLAKYITIAFNLELDKRRVQLQLSNIEVEMIKREFDALYWIENDESILDIDLESFDVYRQVDFYDVFYNVKNKRPTGKTVFSFKFTHNKENVNGKGIDIYTAEDDSNKFGEIFTYANKGEDAYLNMTIDEKIDIIFRRKDIEEEIKEKMEERDNYLDSLSPKEFAKLSEKIDFFVRENQKMYSKFNDNEISECEYEDWCKKNSPTY